MIAPYRVLYFARAPFVSGAERALVSTLRGLDRQRFQPAVILGAETGLVGRLRALDIPVRVIPLPTREPKRWLAWWRSVRAVKGELERFRPQIVHANDMFSAQAMSLAAGQRAIPRVIHLRWPTDAASLAWWTRGGCEQILCVSQWICDDLGDSTATRLAGAELAVLPDPMPWTARSPSEWGRSAVLGTRPTEDAQAGPGTDIQPPRLRLGFAGQLVYVKGLDLVIRAMAALPPERRPLLLVAGEDQQTAGDYQRFLEQLARELGVAGCMQWLGFLEDVGQLYRQVHAVVCPSRIEPLSLVPLEAAEFAVPALGSDLGGFRETILPGVTGYLVEPTVAAWEQVLRSIESPDQLAPLGEAARQRVRTKHSAALYRRRLSRVYLNLLGRPPAEA